MVHHVAALHGHHSHLQQQHHSHHHHLQHLMRVTTSPYPLHHHQQQQQQHSTTRLATPPSPQPSHTESEEADDAAIDVENEDEEQQQQTATMLLPHNAEEMAGKFSQTATVNGHLNNSPQSTVELPANSKTPAMERLLNGLQKPALNNNNNMGGLEDKANNNGNGNFNHNGCHHIQFVLRPFVPLPSVSPLFLNGNNSGDYAEDDDVTATG
ncbi:transcription factor mef2A-like, partial [Musca vetustissima]|uniref:transcription factor mef2A-like n=1 Tax=Musca vetustissima TaxID=27455 RepID=UPI002AB6B92D